MESDHQGHYPNSRIALPNLLVSSSIKNIVRKQPDWNAIAVRKLDGTSLPNKCIAGGYTNQSANTATPNISLHNPTNPPQLNRNYPPSYRHLNKLSISFQGKFLQDIASVGVYGAGADA